jgi:hypothetical protein
MSLGINVFSDNGKLAYSSEYPTYQFLQKISIATNSQGIATTTVISTKAPMVFVEKFSSGFPCVLYMDQSGTSWTISFSGGVPSPHTAVAYIFTVPSVAGSSGYGINIFDDFGNVLFTNKDRVLKINAFHNTNTFNGSSSSMPKIETITSGSIPASWAVNSPNLGWFTSNVSLPVKPIFAIGSDRSSATQIAMSSSCNISQSVAPIDDFFIRGNLYLMFIDTSLYQ